MAQQIKDDNAGPFFYPKIFKEEYSRVEIVQESLAVFIIGVGLALLI